ncbi:protein phosphatase 2C domain-containing protein [Saccharothrix sp.]|uniref:protein phosphatase 2C domain-containing protein n=1 Tax=Saccharothrix sp. TaxID=1873460 RepID=UPI00281232AA|nr:protein phosphatase 2C domain-containing protein [Saccharothrix sp.]
MFTATLRVPKRGNTERECEDAGRVRSADGTVLAAVADGASESLLAGEWATLLTDSLLDSASDVLRDAESFAAGLAVAGLAWQAWLDDYVVGREAAGRPIAWYEQPKLDRGPHATVLAARFGAGRWEAAALGDSCLFQVRDGRLVCAFPLDQANAFDNAPPLFNAFNRDTVLLARHVRIAAGTTEPGDGFFLCTDAVAEWFLRENARGGRPWRVLRGFAGDLEGFAGWLDAVREEGLMRNDDVTVVHVDLG